MCPDVSVRNLCKHSVSFVNQSVSPALCLRQWSSHTQLLPLVLLSMMFFLSLSIGFFLLNLLFFYTSVFCHFVSGLFLTLTKKNLHLKKADAIKAVGLGASESIMRKVPEETTVVLLRNVELLSGWKKKESCCYDLWVLRFGFLLCLCFQHFLVLYLCLLDLAIFSLMFCVYYCY